MSGESGEHNKPDATTSPVKLLSMNILPSKKDRRISHWKEIQTRIMSHEGELLSGEKGKKYLTKYAKNYRGIEWKPTDFSKPEYQKELDKTKK